eukprot:gene8170-10131_t
MSLFGIVGKKKAQPPEQRETMAKALQSIDEQIDLLSKKEEVLQKRINDCTSKAKEVKKKERALPYLRQRKRIMKQVQLVTGQIDNLTSQRFALENATTIAETVKVMKQGNSALKNQGFDVDRLQDEMDDIQEEMQKLDEVTELMSQPMFGETLDDDELLREFEEEELEDLEDMELPDAPSSELIGEDTTVPAQASSARTERATTLTEDAELAELQQW